MNKQEAAKARIAAWNARNPGLAAARAKAWYAANKERAKARIVAWQKSNPEKRSAHMRTDNRKRAKKKQEWELSHPESRARYYESHRAEYIERARIRQRRMRVDQRCACCNIEDFAKIYSLARFIVAEVDHIKPLALGGLHCCKNLQVLSKDEHKKKTIDDRREIARYRLANSPQKAARC